MKINKSNILIVFVLVYLAIRIYMATFSSFGFYHGWNEAWYSSIAKNYFSGSILSQVGITGTGAFFSVPPFFSYTLYAAFNIFGISDLSARLVSILSEIIAIIGIYLLAKGLYDENTANKSVILYILIPWNILWFGRVQTDPLMTALMVLAIALFIRAYKSNTNYFSFGVVLSLAIVTKPPAMAIIPIVALFVYFNSIRRKNIKNLIICTIIGLIPVMVWFFYNLITQPVFFNDFWIGSFTERSPPFSDALKVIILTSVGISPLILMAAFYEIIKMKNQRSNILIFWLLLFGIFVLIKTPPSHEYYSLPLIPPIAILAAVGIIRLSDNLNNWRNLNTWAITVIVIISTLPLTYALLSYSGDIGYTCTKDAGNYLNEYMDQHPEDKFLIVTPSRYVPQMVWYVNLTSSGYSKRQIMGISDDLSSVSIKYLQNISDKINDTSVFLVIDDRQGLEKMMEIPYEKVYESEYITNLSNVARFYTGENVYENYYGQSLSVFKLK